MTILANSDRAHETLRNRILQPEISRAEQRHQRASPSFRPSLPPDHLTPDASPHSDGSRCGGRESKFLQELELGHRAHGEMHAPFAAWQNGTHSVASARLREKFTQPKTHNLTSP